MKVLPFQFSNEYFEQIEGFLMGGEAFSLFADVIINYIFDKAMEITSTKYKPSAFYRYVYDCFSAFNDKNSAIELEKISRIIHPNITFITKMQFNNKYLSFLNVLVDNNKPNLVSSTFCKPTLIGLDSMVQFCAS